MSNPFRDDVATVRLNVYELGLLQGMIERAASEVPGLTLRRGESGPRHPLSVLYAKLWAESDRVMCDEPPAAPAAPPPKGKTA